MIWLFVWLGVAAAYFVVIVMSSLLALHAGRWEIQGVDSYREHVSHALGLMCSWAGFALTWPLALLSVLVNIQGYVKKMQRAIDVAASGPPLLSGGFKMPPQDARSQAQLCTLDDALRAELQAQLGVSALVKFYPLLRHAWLQFREGVGSDAPCEVDDKTLEAWFVAFAEGFAKGELK